MSNIKITFHVIWIFILFILQTTLIKYVQIWNVKPNLLLVYLVIVALSYGNASGALVGFAVGFLMDMFGENFFGMNMLLMMYTGLISGLIIKTSFHKNTFVFVIFVFLISFFYNLLYFCLIFLIWGKGNFLYVISNIIFIESVYNMLLVLPILYIFKKTSGGAAFDE